MVQDERQLGGKRTRAFAALQLQQCGKAVVCSGWRAFTKQMVDQLGKLTDSAPASQTQQLQTSDADEGAGLIHNDNGPRQLTCYGSAAKDTRYGKKDRSLWHKIRTIIASLWVAHEEHVWTYPGDRP